MHASLFTDMHCHRIQELRGHMGSGSPDEIWDVGGCLDWKDALPKEGGQISLKAPQSEQPDDSLQHSCQLGLTLHQISR